MFKMENSLYKAQIRGIFRIAMIQFEVAGTFRFAQEYSTLLAHELMSTVCWNHGMRQRSVLYNRGGAARRYVIYMCI